MEIQNVLPLIEVAAMIILVLTRTFSTPCPLHDKDIVTQALASGWFAMVMGVVASVCVYMDHGVYSLLAITVVCMWYLPHALHQVFSKEGFKAGNALLVFIAVCAIIACEYYKLRTG